MRLAISLLELQIIMMPLLQIMRPSPPLQVYGRLQNSKERVAGMSTFGLENDQHGKPSDLQVLPGLKGPYGKQSGNSFPSPHVL